VTTTLCSTTTLDVANNNGSGHANQKKVNHAHDSSTRAKLQTT